MNRYLVVTPPVNSILLNSIYRWWATQSKDTIAASSNQSFTRYLVKNENSSSTHLTDRAPIEAMI